MDIMHEDNRTRFGLHFIENSRQYCDFQSRLSTSHDERLVYTVLDGVIVWLHTEARDLSLNACRF